MSIRKEKEGILLEQGTGTFEMLTFHVGKEYYGVNVSKITEIIRSDYHITPIPRSDKRIIGMFQPRESILTVIDLNACLFGEDNEIRPLLVKGKEQLTQEETNILHTQHNFIICGFNGIEQAWLVDTVEEITRVPWSDIQKPGITALTEKSYVTGICRDVNERLIQIIDFEAIMTEIAPNTGLTTKSVENMTLDEVEKIKEKNINVYVADDSKMLNTLISDAIAKLGYRVTSFSDGKELLDNLKVLKDNKQLNKCDLVITDIEMPVMDGMQLCKLIKEDNEMCNIPVLIFSSLADDSMKAKCKEIKADMVFTKPELDNVIQFMKEMFE